MTQVSREDWKRRVEEWAASGLTGPAFALKTGVNYYTLRNWKWRFGKHVERVCAKPSEAPGFVEVAALEVKAPDVAAPSSSEPIELITRRGLRIRVPSRFDEGTLRRILSSVEGV